ncbi:uncharacterized protein LOC110411915 isoform X1 [Herrania umbratica]|uniref:Uncharacterized protein LOC110411915 isoform X1 n=1 Tax=Herrania umbratica TaxID=108875 RepID=A0A6J0ZT46_9ROSI|nr:uncharacterized protein LOC110411915 isoform X1 [Herrania umbratica]
MGDLRVCYPNGDISREDRLCPSPFPSPPFSLSLSNPDQPCSIARESWDCAEDTARRIVWSVQPTLDADRKRKEIVEYVQRLIQDGLGYQVFPYGSVPLKTYLPDGDIDLTTLSSPAIEDTLVSDVHAILRGEEHNQKAPYRVKDVHCIDAEVKLVKCLLQDIVVDISFNQLGGLCTLCFLEQIDRLVGKDHLFKRSIILIKAWCYYESRILGAHHGLISTYALETLVLYIFHLFHSSLNGPIAVLYRFLDYFSKFDWENYCISLNGPVCKSSLPDIVAEVPENVGNNPLLSEEFLRKCISMFSVPSKGVETNSRYFPLKHLNIIDPLKENNNLGRSVNRGNYYRIRSAFKYGAHKLEQILILPRERIADELVKFFANTLERHGSNHLTDMQNLPLTSDARGYDHVMSSPCANMCSGNYLFAKPINVGTSNNKMSGSIATSGSRYKLGYPFDVLTSQVVPERKTNVNRNAVSGHCHPGDAKEFVLSGLLAMKGKNDSSDSFPLSCNLGASRSTKPRTCRQIGMVESGDSFKSTLTDSIAADDMSFALKPYSKSDTLAASNVVCKREIAGFFGDSESLKSLLDLTGDYDGQFWSLLYGQYCHLFSVSTPVSPHLQNENHWEIIEQSIRLKQDLYSQRDSNGIWGSQFCFSKPPVAVCTAVDSEDKKKRGTGTYIPIIKYRSNRERHSSGRGIFQASRAYSQFQRYTNNNGSATVQQEMALSQEGSHELSPEEYPSLGPVKFGSPSTHPPYPSVWGLCAANGLNCPPERFESGSSSLELQSTNMPEGNALPDPCTCGSTPSVMITAAQSAKPVLESNQESDAGLSYHLKNEHDFPPLSL